MEILVFGGTAEGRMLVEWLSSLGCCDIVSCTATEYGGELVDGLERVTSLVGPLDDEAKERLVVAHDFACIVDATHPYATHVTASIAALASSHGITRLRLLRDDAHDGAFTTVKNVPEAASAVAKCSGNILLTTGAKDLATFVEAIPDFDQRLFARILPVKDSVERAHELGIPTSHIIAMQGPFSREMNEALLRQFDIRTMVTKASGSTGGFQEKIDAAEACGATLVVIERPEEQDGLPYAEVQKQLLQMMGENERVRSLLEEAQAADYAQSTDEDRPAPQEPHVEPSVSSSANGQADGEDASCDRTVYLVGIGLGNPDTMTLEAVKAVEASDLLIGAKRMLEPYADKPCKKLPLIKSADIADALRTEDYTHASVLFSGDVGFYSGATALAELLTETDVRAIPGISSVVCLCARLLTPWQDVHLVSAHGRECDPVSEVRTHAKTFMLTGGKTKARDVCQMLLDAGLGNVTVHVGERLSYDDERIISGTAADLATQDFVDLAVMLVENPAAPKRIPGKLES